MNSPASTPEQSATAEQRFEDWLDREFPIDGNGRRQGYRNRSVSELMQAAWVAASQPVAAAPVATDLRKAAQNVVAAFNDPHCSLASVQNYVTDLRAALQQRQAPVQAEAIECLRDVVSHHQDFHTACATTCDLHLRSGDKDSADYWSKQLHVLARMKVQAEKALAQQAEASPVASAEPVNAIVRDVCELDYTGEDWDAEKMLSVTVDDLRRICERHIVAQAAPAPAEPVAERWAIYYDNLGLQPYESGYMESWELHESEADAQRKISGLGAPGHYRAVKVYVCAAPPAVGQAVAAVPATDELYALRRLIECAQELDKRPRPMCRDCADEDGTCPNSKLECDMGELFAKAKRLYNRLASPAAHPATEPALLTDSVEWMDVMGAYAEKPSTETAVALTNFADSFVRRAAGLAVGGAARVEIARGRVWIVKGNQLFMLAYEPEAGDDPAEMEAYAAQLRAALSIFTPDVKMAVGGAAELPELDEGDALRKLAFRTLWLAYVWNDHNFKAADVEARETCEALGIHSFDEANAWVTELNNRAALASRPDALAAPELPHGHRDDYFLIANARRLTEQPIRNVRGLPNWNFAAELFATGSNSAYEICARAGIDPYGTTIERAATPAKPELSQQKEKQ